MSRLINRVCAECGQTFQCKPGPKKFCSPAHRNAFDNRSRARGYLLVPFSQVWRSGKRKRTEDVAYAFGELCRLLDLWNAEDKAAGRRPDLVISRRNQRNWNAIDTADNPRRKAAPSVPCEA